MLVKPLADIVRCLINDISAFRDYGIDWLGLLRVMSAKPDSRQWLGMDAAIRDVRPATINNCCSRLLSKEKL
jgi:hypothetical protein